MTVLVKGSWTGVAAEQLAPSTAHLALIRAFPLEEETTRAPLGQQDPLGTDTAGPGTPPSLSQKGLQEHGSPSYTAWPEDRGLSAVGVLVRNTGLLGQSLRSAWIPGALTAKREETALGNSLISQAWEDEMLEYLTGTRAIPGVRAVPAC